MREKFFKFNDIPAYITIVCAAVAVVLNNFNILTESTFKNVIILLLGLLGIDTLVATRSRLEKIDLRLWDLTNQTVKIKKFKNNDDAIEYLLKRTQESKLSIHQAAIDTMRTQRTSPLRQKYEEVRENLILSDSITYKYICIGDLERRINAMTTLMKKADLSKLFVAYSTSISNDFPLMSFIVFDKCEVFIRVPYGYGEDANYITIKGEDIARFYLDYFEKIWSGCKKFDCKKTLDNLIVQDNETEIVFD